MLHIVHLIERRFPGRGTRIVAMLALLSASAVGIGAGWLLQ